MNAALCGKCKNCIYDKKDGMVCGITNTQRIIISGCDDFERISSRAQYLSEPKKVVVEGKHRRVDRILAILGLIPSVLFIPVMLFIVFLREDLITLFVMFLASISFIGFILVLATTSLRTLKLILFGVGFATYFIAILVSMNEGPSKSHDFLVMLLIGLPYILMAVLFFRILGRGPEGKQ